MASKLMSRVLVSFILLLRSVIFNHVSVVLIILEFIFADNSKIKGNSVNSNKHPCNEISGHLLRSIRWKLRLVNIHV